MSSLQRLGWDSQSVLSVSEEAEACEDTTSSSSMKYYQDIVSLVWFVIIGLCIWHAPRLLEKWLYVSLVCSCRRWCCGMLTAYAKNVTKVIESYRHLRRVWYAEDQTSHNRNADIMPIQQKLGDQKIESNRSWKTQDAASSGK